MLAAAVAPAGCTGMKSSEFGELTPPLASAPSAAKTDRLPTAPAAAACCAVGENEEKNHNAAAALLQYERAEQLDPANISAARRLAVLYDDKCDFAKADVEYKKVTQARPHDAELLADWGYSYYLRNDWNAAVRKLQHALELDPKNARARCNLGMALGALDRYDQALEAFHVAGLSDAECHTDLAFVYLAKGKMTEARREVEFARVKDPFCAKANELLAKLDGPRKSADDVAARPTSRKPAAPDAAIGRPPAPLGEEPGVKPIYKSPNGLAWVPVTKSAAPAAPAEAAGEPGPLVVPDE
jgi:Flp pilus assembly protein TadD